MASPEPAAALWTSLPEPHSGLGASQRAFPGTGAIDDSDVVAAHLRLKGFTIVRREDEASGRVAWSHAVEAPESVPRPSHPDHRRRA